MTPSQQGQYRRLIEKRIHYANMVIFRINDNDRRTNYWAGQADKIDKKIQKLHGGNND